MGRRGSADFHSPRSQFSHCSTLHSGSWTGSIDIVRLQEASIDGRALLRAQIANGARRTKEGREAFDQVKMPIPFDPRRSQSNSMAKDRAHTLFPSVTIGWPSDPSPNPDKSYSLSILLCIVLWLVSPSNPPSSTETPPQCNIPGNP